MTQSGTVRLIWIPAAIGSPFMIDPAACAGSTFRPFGLIVTRTKADGTPRLDTMFVDAAAVRNAKWICVDVSDGCGF